MFGALYAAEGSSIHALDAVAREFSPRVTVEGTVPGSREVTLDLAGLERLFGDGRTIAHELRRTAAEHGLRVRVAVAATRTAARLLVHAHPGLTAIDAGGEVTAVGELPIDALAAVVDNDARSGAPAFRLADLRRWGLRTLGDFTRLPAGDVAARLGQEGVLWQRLSRGEDVSPIVPMGSAERFEEAMDLEWPIEGLEPLSFVLARLLEPLSRQLDRQDRGAAVIRVSLQLVTREVHERALQLPTPIRDARMLRTLALLDLESHPPGAAIDRVTVSVDPPLARVVQFSLLTRQLPTPDQVSTLLARLGALMGEDRCGAPAEVQSWQPGAFAMRAFAPMEQREPSDDTAQVDMSAPVIATALRRFRVPVPARVRVEHETLVRVTTDRRGLTGGRVEACAGPWRTSGGWWASAGDPGRWDRDEWDVTVSGGATYRVFRDRAADAWFLDRIVD